METESQYHNQHAETNSQNYENNQHEVSGTTKPAFEYYSVGVNQDTGLRDKILKTYEPDSKQVNFLGELEDFLSNTKKYKPALEKFKNYVKNHMLIPQNADHFIDEFINSGYIKALERISFPGSDKDLKFYEDYARYSGTSLPQAVLFGPNGTAKQFFSQWKLEEMLKGQHRGTNRPETPQMAQNYDKAVENTYSLPAYKNEQGDYESIDIADNKDKSSEGIESRFAHVFGREKQLYQTLSYKGTKRLAGDLPYQVLEAMAIELLVKQKAALKGSSAKLEDIIEQANHEGKDVFCDLYNYPYTDRKVMENAWNDARKILNDYALNLWKQRNGFDKECVKIVEKKLPGTIYLDGNRYGWIPKHGEAKVSLVPEKYKDKLPGCLSKHKTGGYSWFMRHLNFRRKLVSEGQKKATKDFKTAKKLQMKEWEKIQKYEPKLAEKLKKTKKWGQATKHKPTAVKIAKKLWAQIQENDPQAASRILSDQRPEISKPDIDKVWPGWIEQKERLALMENKPQLPVVYPKQGLREEWEYGLRVPEKLENIVDKMKKVDWIRDNAILVFDDNSPKAAKEIAIQSNGKEWTDKYDEKNQNYLIQGSASMDKDTGRIRFTVYQPGYNSPETLIEEVYHTVFEIIRQSSPETLKTVQKWHQKNIANGSDPTLSLSEAFSQAMIEEELGHRSSLPANVVRHAQKIFSEKNNVSPEVMAKVKKN